MKRKILVPMFASLMALSMNTVANADKVKDEKENNIYIKISITIHNSAFVSYDINFISRKSIT